MHESPELRVSNQTLPGFKRALVATSRLNASLLFSRRFARLDRRVRSSAFLSIRRSELTFSDFSHLSTTPRARQEFAKSKD